TRSKASFSRGPGSRVPALLNTISASEATSASAATDAADRTSRSAVTTSGRSSVYAERAVAYTFRAPRASTSSTSAALSPRRPPVTTTTLPATATMAPPTWITRSLVRCKHKMLDNATVSYTGAVAMQFEERLRNRDAWSIGGRCSTARVLDLLNTKTVFLVVRECFYGTTRFEDFVTRIGTSAPAVSRALNQLKAAGVIVPVL